MAIRSRYGRRRFAALRYRRVIAVALGLCFVADCVQGCVIALDAAELKVRFKFGYAELCNPLGVAWHEGLLWVADDNNQSGHASRV